MSFLLTFFRLLDCSVRIIAILFLILIFRMEVFSFLPCNFSSFFMPTSSRYFTVDYFLITEFFALFLPIFLFLPLLTFVTLLYFNWLFGFLLFLIFLPNATSTSSSLFYFWSFFFWMYSLYWVTSFRCFLTAFGFTDSSLLSRNSAR